MVYKQLVRTSYNRRKMKMRILIGYDGSEGADAAIDDLRNAGLPRDAEALIVSIAGS